MKDSYTLLEKNWTNKNSSQEKKKTQYPTTLKKEEKTSKNDIKFAKKIKEFHK